jgi:hypothetical protein
MRPPRMRGPGEPLGVGMGGMCACACDAPHALASEERWPECVDLGVGELAASTRLAASIDPPNLVRGCSYALCVLGWVDGIVLKNAHSVDRAHDTLAAFARSVHSYSFGCCLWRRRRLRQQQRPLSHVAPFVGHRGRGAEKQDAQEDQHKSQRQHHVRMRMRARRLSQRLLVWPYPQSLHRHRIQQQPIQGRESVFALSKHASSCAVFRWALDQRPVPWAEGQLG